MKKICFLCGNLENTGGTERVSSIIANSLDNVGYSVYMLSLSGDKSYFHLNKRVKYSSLLIDSSRKCLSYFKVVYKLRCFLQKNKIDILIDVDTILSLFTLPSLWGLNVKQISWEHFSYNMNFNLKKRSLSRFLVAKYSDYIVTLTKKDKEIWMNKTGRLENITAIANPCTYGIRNNNPSLEARTVLAIGRLCKIKSFDLLIRAWSCSYKDLSGWKLIIVGEGEEKENLLCLINKLNMEDTVEIHPFSDRVEEYYEKASFLCLSSQFEGFPMVLLECLSFSLPVVSFDCDLGPRELVFHNENGFLVEPNNIESMSHYIIKMANLPIAEYERMKLFARSYALNFSLENITKQWIQIIENL